MTHLSYLHVGLRKGRLNTRHVCKLPNLAPPLSTILPLSLRMPFPGDLLFGSLYSRRGDGEVHTDCLPANSPGGFLALGEGWQPTQTRAMSPKSSSPSTTRTPTPGGLRVIYAQILRLTCPNTDRR